MYLYSKIGTNLGKIRKVCKVWIYMQNGEKWPTGLLKPYNGFTVKDK